MDRFLEIWSNNNKASSRVKELIDIFDVEDFEVVGLIRRGTSVRTVSFVKLFGFSSFFSFAVVLYQLLITLFEEILMKGEDLEESIKMTRPWKSEPSKRLFVESNRPGDPTVGFANQFCLSLVYRPTRFADQTKF